MSFIASLEADPETQRFNKAAIHLRALVFGRLSDDHVVALALLHELTGLYRRAYDTDQVTHAETQRGSQEEALENHLRALELPCSVAELTSPEVQSLISAWKVRGPLLPRPFDEMLRAFILHAEAQLNTDPTRGGLEYRQQTP